MSFKERESAGSKFVSRIRKRNDKDLGGAMGLVRCG